MNSPSTGDADLDRRIAELLDAAISERNPDGRNNNRDQLRRIMTQAVLMATDGADRLDLKIAASALQEMRDSYLMFRPHRHRQKVTIFGSARTKETDPLYDATRRVAAAFAARGWMVVTGAGPGLMSAGLEGAGRQNALGVTIRLPFEEGQNGFVFDDHLVSMKYFFTRKLALIRESQGFVVMPGGFGTLDESFELLTLLQTGKAEPVPIVLVGLGQGYWRAWQQFVDTVIEQGYVNPSDRRLYRITEDIDIAVDEIVGFYRNYHSIRWEGSDLIVRLQRAPGTARLDGLNREFGDLVERGRIVVTVPTAAEIADDEVIALPRLRLTPSRRAPGRLRDLIDAVNLW